MGWYHSHPFDVQVHSNAFLSATDVSTQMPWQITEDNGGNPWIALVVRVPPPRRLARKSRQCAVCAFAGGPAAGHGQGPTRDRRIPVLPAGVHTA